MNQATRVAISGGANEAAQQSQVVRRSWLLWLVVVAAALSILAISFAWPLVWAVIDGKAQLVPVVRETDALEPHWRREYLVASVPELSPVENGWHRLEELVRRYDRVRGTV
ncbi:MAG: hypothetical protein RMI91_09635 [Gemmatales bacterium]|nr:hypothetical protein [Gemmatales bacterium]MDW7994901.1 hypothetical protein [Gemmatales bacterium]